jgi:hypothetical protein
MTLPAPAPPCSKRTPGGEPDGEQSTQAVFFSSSLCPCLPGLRAASSPGFARARSPRASTRTQPTQTAVAWALPCRTAPHRQGPCLAADWSHTRTTRRCHAIHRRRTAKAPPGHMHAWVFFAIAGPRPRLGLEPTQAPSTHAAVAARRRGSVPCPRHTCTPWPRGRRGHAAMGGSVMP